MTLDEIGKEPIRYAKWSDSSIAIWNPFLALWEVKLKFGSKYHRERWWETIEEHQKSTLLETLPHIKGKQHGIHKT